MQELCRNAALDTCNISKEQIVRCLASVSEDSDFDDGPLYMKLQIEGIATRDFLKRM